MLLTVSWLLNHSHCQGLNLFEPRGEREWHLGVREQEREWIIPFPKFGNGKGIEKTHSLNSGTGREWKKTIPKIREWEGNEKIYSQNSGTGREWKKSIPTIREWESEAIIPKNTREREREWKKHNMTIKKYLANMWHEIVSCPTRFFRSGFPLK